jgi:hypothetical protein
MLIFSVMPLGSLALNRLGTNRSKVDYVLIADSATL